MLTNMNNETRHDAASRTTGESGGANIGEHETTQARAKNGKQTSRGRSPTPSTGSGVCSKQNPIAERSHRIIP